MNTYLLDRPAVVSFSGGRTSGFMLRNVLDAFGGRLPDDVAVVFANTGLEHPKTYEFIEAVERNWGVPIHWIEYMGRDAIASVRPDTASRNGEPFSRLIRVSNMLPNPVQRKCTAELKINALHRYIRDTFGWVEFTNAIGLRFDEPRRVAKIRADPKHENSVVPLYDAGHSTLDVMAFWGSNNFDLELPGGDNSFGNCVGCFLKGRGLLMRLMRAEPQHFNWWVEAERVEVGVKSPSTHTFRSDRPSYAQMLDVVRRQGVMFDEGFDEEDTISCACTD